MDYRQFSAVDLAADSTFIDWIQHPNPAKTAFWEGYLAQNPDRADVVAEARRLVTNWQLNLPVPTEGSRDDVWLKIQANTMAAGYEHPRPGLVRFIDRPYLMRYAAVLLGVLVTAAIYFLGRGQATVTYYATGKNGPKTVLLADGSTVVLAANSSISLTGDWKPEHPRELALQGEAYFVVTHRQNHQKFVVRAPGNLRIEVLGTRFTVLEHPTGTRVVLNAGQVALYLNKANRPLLMKPGELIDVPTVQQQPVIRRQVTPEVYSAWTVRAFVFEDTSLGEIAAMIETEFSQKISFANDSLKDLRVTLRLPNRDLNLLLTALAEIHDLKIDRQTSRILIARNAVAP